MHHIDKIGKKFAEEYKELNESSFGRIDKLLNAYYDVPKDVFGDDFVKQYASSYSGNKIEFESTGWTQERIDKINSFLARLFNEAKNIYESTKDIKPKTIEIAIDEFFIYHLTFFELTNKTKGKQYQAVEKVLSAALNGYTLNVEDSLIINASNTKEVDFSKYGKLYMQDNK